MVGGFCTNRALRSGTNQQLCRRCLIFGTHDSGISIPLLGTACKDFAWGLPIPTSLRLSILKGGGGGVGGVFGKWHVLPKKFYI